MSKTGRMLAGCVMCGVLAVGSGCITTSTLSSPDVVPPAEMSAAFGFTNVPAVGLGSIVAGFRYGMAERMDAGVTLDMLTLRMDARYQFLVSEDHVLDADVEFGVGMMAFILPTYFVGLHFGLDFERVAPYIGYRYTMIGFTDTDNDSINDDFDVNTIDGWGQLTIGVQLNLSENFAIVPEYSVIDTLEGVNGERLDTFSVGFRFGTF